MTNTFRVAISSLFLLGMFFAAALTWEGCTGKKQAQTLEEKADEAVEKFATDTDDFFEEDLETDYDTGTGEISYSETDDADVEFSDIEDKAPVVESTPAPSTPSSSNYSTSSSSGKYMIVAGNFLVEDNASKMVSKLSRMGYNSAESSVFDYSQYHTVIVTRTDDYSRAQRLSSELKGQGIDNYVHTRK